MKFIRTALLATVLLAGLVCPHAHAKAPAGRYTINANGTVYDTWSKLTWQQAVDVGSYTWSATSVAGSAQAYCAALALAGGGWHLPNVTELRTLVDRQQYSPAIDPMAFPSTPAGYFWSATVYQGSSTYAWFVGFVTGSYGNSVLTTTYRVRCVR